MQILTPSGYRDAASLATGDEVCAFDAETGAPIVNHVEAMQPVDYAEWCRWWQVEETSPAFNWIRVNGSFLLFRKQSIWRNGTNVCHAKHLVIGDEIYDDAYKPITITSVETVTDESMTWYRFDIDGDHSYIVDGLTVHNASRFWVGGTGTWDAATTTHWAASSGGAGGKSVPRLCRCCHVRRFERRRNCHAEFWRNDHAATSSSRKAGLTPFPIRLRGMGDRGAPIVVVSSSAITISTIAAAAGSTGARSEP